MLLARLDRAASRLPASRGLAAALDFLRRPDLAALPDGRYDIDGERVYAMVQRYGTAPAAEPRFEAHRRYADVQYLAEGCEVIGWAPLEALREEGPYDAASDVVFGRAADWTPARLGAGQLAVLYPEDAHAPRLAAGAPGPVAKVVVKVAVELL